MDSLGLYDCSLLISPLFLKLPLGPCQFSSAPQCVDFFRVVYHVRVSAYVGVFPLTALSLLAPAQKVIIWSSTSTVKFPLWTA